ncbi:hypothetical protein HN873_052000, partial [Arachis hypogaea]
EPNPSLKDIVTLDSLANSVEQLTQIVQSLVQRLENNVSSPSKVFKVFGSNSKTLNKQNSASNNPLLLCCIEKAKTDLSIAKKRRIDSLALINIPGLELPSWVQVCFRPIASMGLDETELAIAAYLYGNHLMDNYEEDIVFSELTAHRDVFRSLIPGKPIISLVLDIVADMMRIELTRESGYWFLPTTFALSEKTKLDPNRLPLCITYVYLGKVDCLKRVFIPVSETTNEGHEHWYLVVIDRVKRQIILLDPLPIEKQFKRKRTALKLAIYLDEVLEDRSFYDFETTPNLISSQFEFEEPEDLPTLKTGSSNAGVWVASWMIACFEDDHFNIKVDDGIRMKIAVSLVLKNHNMISYRHVSLAGMTLLFYNHESPSILKLSLRIQVLSLCCAGSKAINDPKASCQRKLYSSSMQLLREITAKKLDILLGLLSSPDASNISAMYLRMISLGALYVTVRIHASVAVNIGGNNINLMLKVPLLTPDLAEAFISLLQGTNFFLRGGT